MSRGLALTLLLSSTLTTAAFGQSAPIVNDDDRIGQLKAGEYLWAPEIAPAGPVMIIISLKAQKAYAYRNGVLIGVSTVSTGSKGHPTPTGVFTVLQKAADHVSSIYKGAAMPFMQRLTWGGVALHAGNLPGYPASHGCIRLPLAFAKLLFAVTRMGVTVMITEEAVAPIVVATPAILKRGGDAIPGSSGAENFVWNPTLSSSGPVSIVISGRDKRIVVLRNGVEIGASPIGVDAAIERTSAFSLQSVDANGEHWLRLPIPGETKTGELSADEQAKGHLPEAFRANLATVLTPGATLLVTPKTLADAGTGKSLTIIEASGRRR